MGLDRKESGEIGRATGVLAGATMLSRVLGLVRNQILSHFFGASYIADAFIAAFTIPNALRRLFGEGALTPAFVSLFTRRLKNESSGPEAQEFADSSFTWLSLIAGLSCLVGIAASPILVFVYVPEFRDIEGKFDLTVGLTRFLFPFLLLISWSALFMGVLNSLKKFAIPALGPAVLNLSVILICPLVLWWGDFSDETSIYIFSASILFGAFLQALIQIPALIKCGCLPRLKKPSLDPKVMELMRLLLPSIFGMGVYQLNIIINRIFASDIPGAVSHLFYSDLLVELPVSLIATSMAVAAVPSFTRLVVLKDPVALGKTFSFSFSMNASLAFASAAGIFVLAGPLISSIFFTGEFDSEDWKMSTQCLIMYSAGLPFFCLLRSLLPLYYAEKDTRTPVYVGILALIVNLIGAWTLSKSMGAPGIALATSLSSAVNFLVLLVILSARHPEFPWGAILKSTIKAILASGLMLLSLFFLLKIPDVDLWSQQGLSFIKVIWLFGFVGIGASIYLIVAKILGLDLAEFIFRRLGIHKR